MRRFISSGQDTGAVGAKPPRVWLQSWPGEQHGESHWNLRHHMGPGLSGPGEAGCLPGSLPCLRHSRPPLCFFRRTPFRDVLGLVSSPLGLAAAGLVESPGWAGLVSPAEGQTRGYHGGLPAPALILQSPVRPLTGPLRSGKAS